MNRRQSVLSALAALTPTTTKSADWKQKDPARLQAAAVAIAVSGKPADLADLARQLSDPAFLRRLDPEPGSLTRFAEVFQALSAHPSPATAALCLQVAQSSGFDALPSRWNFLLAALAAVRPMTADAARLFQKTGRSGFLEVNISLLAGNATPEALKVMESLFMDETQAVEQRINAAHWGILPNRLRPGVADSCGQILSGQSVSPRVKLAVVESLFDNRPAEWFGKRSPYPAPPAWTQATPEVRTAYAKVADIARRVPHLPAHVSKAIDDAMRQLAPGN
jgi:uncharacterized membrane protein YfbV (UPF0208 family)